MRVGVTGTENSLQTRGKCCSANTGAAFTYFERNISQAHFLNIKAVLNGQLRKRQDKTYDRLRQFSLFHFFFFASLSFFFLSLSRFLVPSSLSRSISRSLAMMMMPTIRLLSNCSGPVGGCAPSRLRQQQTRGGGDSGLASACSRLPQVMTGGPSSCLMHTPSLSSPLSSRQHLYSEVPTAALPPLVPPRLWEAEVARRCCAPTTGGSDLAQLHRRCCILLHA